MSMKSYKDYVSKPTQEHILSNMSSNLDKFIEVMRELSDQTSELAKKNQASLLLQKNFKSHPHIHIGYYDERRNNVLYVRDALDNDKLIEKQKAVLLCDGRFASSGVDSKDPKILFDPAYVVGHVGGALSGSDAEKKWCEGKYFYEDSTGLYIPIVLSDYKKCISLNHLCDSFYSSFRHFQENHGQPFRPLSRDLFDIEGFIQFYRTSVAGTVGTGLSRSLRERIIVVHKCSLDNYLQIPENSPILPGILILGDFGTRITQVIDRSARGEYATINVDEGGTAWGFTPEGPIFAAYEMGSFPFRLGVRIAASSQSSRSANSQTDNNFGKVLAHNAKVDHYKVGFLMSDEEKVFFDKKSKEHQVLMKAHSDELNKLKKRYSAGELSPEVYKKMYAELKAPARPPQDYPVFLGVEVELTCKGKHRSGTGQSIVIKEIAESKFGDHCIVKHDGSLGDYGIEITTVPATLSHQLKMFNHFFEYGGKEGSLKYNPKALNIVDKLMSNERCGIHVHISRNSLSATNWGKFQDFMYNPVNAPFIDKMAGRKPNVYCLRLEAKDSKKAVSEFTKKVTSDGTLKGQLKFADEPRNDTIRRVSVNVQNAHTIEVRIFKSSTDKNNVLRKLEFCDALVRMLQTKDIGLRSFDYFDFINFILEKDNRKRYIHVTRWLSSQGLIGHERKRVKNKESKLYNKIVTAYKYNLAKIPQTEFYKSKEFKETWQYHPNNKVRG